MKKKLKIFLGVPLVLSWFGFLGWIVQDDVLELSCQATVREAIVKYEARVAAASEPQSESMRQLLIGAAYSGLLDDVEKAVCPWDVQPLQREAVTRGRTYIAALQEGGTGTPEDFFRLLDIRREAFQAIGTFVTRLDAAPK